jgi:IS4 transposase
MDWDTNQWIETSFRLLIATMDKTGEQIYFLTNVEHLTAYEITFIYKQRWDIEVFFKFLKQELNLNHLVSRNENGIKVMIYMTLIVAILLLAYKKLNKLKGYKLVKLQFANELEQEIFKEMVIICNENPMIMKQLFNDS